MFELFVSQFTFFLAFVFAKLLKLLYLSVVDAHSVHLMHNSFYFLRFGLVFKQLLQEVRHFLGLEVLAHLRVASRSVRLLVLPDSVRHELRVLLPLKVWVNLNRVVKTVLRILYHVFLDVL